VKPYLLQAVTSSTLIAGDKKRMMLNGIPEFQRLNTQLLNAFRRENRQFSFNRI
jgi:hypothetical protein